MDQRKIKKKKKNLKIRDSSNDNAFTSFKMFHSINCLLGPTVDRTYHLLATKIEEERLQGRERVRYQRAEDKERG